MRIAIHQEQNNAFNHMMIGWAQALNHCGNKVAFWHPTITKTFDMFYEFNPEAVICHVDHLHLDLLKCLLKSECKVIVRLSEWGPLADAIGPQYLRMATDQQVEAVQILKNANRLHLMFTHYLEDDIDTMVGGWKQFGVKILSSPMAGDTVTYKPNQSEEFKCDVGFVGGHWPEKARYLNWLVKLRLDDPTLKMKVFGYGNWPLLEFAGSITPQNEALLLHNAACVPNLMEPFAVAYGCDVNERTFTTGACGGLSLVHDTKATRQMFGDTVQYFRSYQDLLTLVTAAKFSASGIDERQRLYDLIIDKHNYINRTTDILTEVYT